MVISESRRAARPLIDLLVGASCRAVLAASEQSVTKLLAAGGIDAIVVALSLDEQDSAHLCRWLKQQQSAAERSVPIFLAQTPLDEQEGTAERESAGRMAGWVISSGADDYFSAPLDAEEILSKLSRFAVGGRSRPDEHHADTAFATADAPRPGDVRGAGEDYRALFESAPLPMWLSDPQTLAFVDVNEAAVAHYGYARDEFLRLTVTDLSRSAPTADESTPKLVVGKRRQTSVNTTESAGRHRTKSGETIDVELSEREVSFGGRRLLLTLAKDVTERRRAESTLEQQAERHALVNRISSAVRRSLDPAEVFRTAVKELGQHLNVDRCLLFVMDAEAGVVRSVAGYSTPGAEPAQHEFSIDLVSWLIDGVQKDGVVAFDDVANDPRLRHIYEQVLRDMEVKSAMYVAIRVGADIPAALAFSTTRSLRHWRGTDVALAQAVAVQTGIAIRQAELFAMVARAKEQWESTFNAMSDGVFVFDETGALVRVNQAGAELEEASVEDLIGRHCCQLLYSTRENCLVSRCLRERRRVTDEISLPHLNRSLIFTAEPILAGEDRRVTGAVCSVRDLSELRKIEAVAREHQSLLRSVLDSAREAIYALDTEGRVQWCNKGVANMGGYAPEDLIGHHFLEWAQPSEHGALRERFARALGGESQSYEMDYFGADGQLRSSVVDHAPLVNDGQTTGVLGIARDVTEQRAARERIEQAEKLRALGQLASGVAHDFNNALAAIIGRAQLLSRLVQDGTLASHLDVIQTAAADAAATVRRIQTFARQPRVKEFELLNLASILRDAIELTRTRWETEARARDLRYDVQLDCDAEIYIEGSASELREVFVNLIVNAVDAMPRGGSLLIVCRRAADRIHLLFTDVGGGMTEDVRRRIFEPFFSTKGAHGTGLGLFVSYGIIERHRGSITVESEIGRGTTFVIDLPALEGTWSRDHLPAAAAAVSPSAIGERGLAVLVVDDESYVRETLAEFVATMAHRVVRADGGRAALAAIAGGDAFDVVLLDLTMPEMNGWEVAREIRQHQPHAKIILTTGYAEDVLPPPGEEDLIDAVIGKPFTFEQIAEALANFSEDGVTSDK